jgi:MFS superfamily sulfate permease-like transporter
MTRWNPQVTLKENFWNDFLASVVVFLTALPLCMGIALASGAPIEAGIVTGVVGGILVGSISGSPLQVSGPAAGLTVLVYEIIQQHGFAGLSLMLVLAGLIQALAGGFKLGQLFRAVSPAVINGMLTGIGVLIFCSQIFVMMDLKPQGSGLANLGAIPSALSDAIAAPTGQHAQALFIGLVTIGIIVIWRRIAVGRLKAIPGALVGVLFATAYAAICQSPVAHVSLPDNIFSAIQLPKLSVLSQFNNWEVFNDAFALALIASAETLLSAAAVDRMHRGKRCQYDRELLSQGIGNTICGLIGGLPMTGVIARSSVNVHAGAKTRLSAVLHGVWLLAFVLLIPKVLQLVPISCLAALLVYTAFKLVDVKAVRKLWSYGKRLVAIYAATIIAIVTTDLLTGVLIGVVLSFAKLLYTMSRLDVRVENNTGKTVMHLQGAATFISMPKIADALEQVPPNTELHVSLDDLDYVDHSCLELIMDWEKRHQSMGGTLVVDWGELGAMFKHKRKMRAQRPSPWEHLDEPQVMAAAN